MGESVVDQERLKRWPVGFWGTHNPVCLVLGHKREVRYAIVPQGGPPTFAHHPSHRADRCLRCRTPLQ